MRAGAARLTAAVLLVGLAGCTGDDPAPAPGSASGSASASVDGPGSVPAVFAQARTAITPLSSVDDDLEGYRAVDGPDVRLPRVELRQQDVAAVRELDRSALRVAQLPQEVVRDGRATAAAGRELVVASVTVTRGMWAGSAQDGSRATPDDRPELVIRADGQATPVPVDEWDRDPGTGDAPSIVVVVSVPRGEAVQLAVSDLDRTAALDLRTGRPADELARRAAALPDEAKLAGQDRTLSGTAATTSTPVLSGDVDIRLGFGSGTAFLQLWTPTRGWASTGNVWLVASLEATASSGGLLPGIPLALTPRTVTVVADGRSFPMTGTLQLVQYSVGARSFVFRVPPTLTRATLRIDASAGQLGDTRWTKRPGAATARIDFG